MREMVRNGFHIDSAIHTIHNHSQPQALPGILDGQVKLSLILIRRSDPDGGGAVAVGFEPFKHKTVNPACPKHTAHSELPGHP